MRIALCIRGAISRKESYSFHAGDIYKEGSLVNYRAVFNSIKKHILDANPSKIDVFLQSWNPLLREELESLYNPVLSSFEDNNAYADEIMARCSDPKEFSGVSQALSIKKAIELKEKHEDRSGFTYDKVVLYRPDVLIWKNMALDDYDLTKGIFVNAHPGGNGDFHFVMSSTDAKEFKGLYDSPLRGNRCIQHHWIQNFIRNFMKRPLVTDEIIPGQHQEVARPHKIKEFVIGLHGIEPSFLLQYGMAMEDLIA